MSETPRWLWLVAVGIFGLHVALVRYFFGDALPLPEAQFSRGDFATHAAQVRRVIEGIETSGKPWVYDVQLLAGAPNGVLFNADNKGWEIWTYLLVQLGVPEGKAYNGFVLALHLAFPLVIYGSARLFRLDRPASVTAMGLGVLLWSFDSFTHWMWWIGTVSYVTVAYTALLPLGLFHRWLQDRRWGVAVACAVVMAGAHLIHPYIFFILVAPMLAEYIRAGFVQRTMKWHEHALTVGIAAVTVLANLWWLRTALKFIHYLLDSAFYEKGGIAFVVYDLFGILTDPSTQGIIGPRTAVRLVCLVTTILALRAWKHEDDPRRLPFLVLVVTMAALTYLGGYTFFAQIQPYRHNLPLGFALLIPAGWWLSATLRERPWAGLDDRQRALVGIVAALAALHLSRDVLYFFAPSLPAEQELRDGKTFPMGALGHGFTPGYRYDQQHDWEELIEWIDEHDDSQGRFLIQDEVLGEYLMARTTAQLIGGFRVRNIQHSDANWFRANPDHAIDPGAFRKYLETYGVRWVIISSSPDAEPWWDQHPGLLARAGFVDGFRIYRVQANFRLVRGRGKVRASVNRLEVTGTRKNKDVVLRYHWMETLRCTPGCAIEREPVEGDRVGFIRVPAPHPRDFVIENAYEWPE